MEEFLNKVDNILEKRYDINREYDLKFNKAAANWCINVIPHLMKERGYNEETIGKFIPFERLRELVAYVEFTNLLDFTTGKKVLATMVDDDEDAWTVMTKMDLLFKADTSDVEKTIDEVLGRFPDKVIAYKGGKKGLLGMMVGEVMRSIKGVNGKEVQELLRNKLES